MRSKSYNKTAAEQKTALSHTPSLPGTRPSSFTCYEVIGHSFFIWETARRFPVSSGKALFHSSAGHEPCANEGEIVLSHQRCPEFTVRIVMGIYSNGVRWPDTMKISSFLELAGWPQVLPLASWHWGTGQQRCPRTPSWAEEPMVALRGGAACRGRCSAHPKSNGRSWHGK